MLPNKALQLTANSAFQLRSGSLLASSLGWLSELIALALTLAAATLLSGHSVYTAALVWQLVLASLQFLLLVTQTKSRSAV